jgi:hypothetical protein
MQKPIVGLLSGGVVMLLVAMGCTHKPVHSTKSEREWANDHKACEKWVREGIRDDPDTYDNFDEMRLIRQCMKDKGWRWERTSLFDFNKKNEK